jgi:hypothetical protein
VTLLRYDNSHQKLPLDLLRVGTACYIIITPGLEHKAPPPTGTPHRPARHQPTPHELAYLHSHTRITVRTHQH